MNNFLKKNKVEKNTVEYKKNTVEYTAKKIGLSIQEYEEIEREKKYYENPRAISIEALKIVQKNRGWISDDAITSIAKLLDISDSDVEGVATFYSRIFRRPVGRYVIFYCDSVVCYINGYQEIKSVLEQYLNINSGQTTSDGRFTLLPTCCLGKCDKGPTMMVNDKTYVYLTPDNIKLILKKYNI